MADEKTTELDPKAAPADVDIFALVDVAGGTVSKRTTKAELLAVLQGEVNLNTAKVSADGSVTTHNDVTDAGSGIIISDTERTKLNGIEAGAQVNQDDATIKVQYENNADTNAFTDAEQTKLAAAITKVEDDPTPKFGGDVDTTSFGFYVNSVAGENIAAEDVVIRSTVSPGEVLRANATSTALAVGFIGLAIESKNATEAIRIAWLGPITVTGPLTPGAAVYLSETTGQVTETPPALSGSFVRVIGFARSATILDLLPSTTFIEVT